ncbi:hypothetical protein AVEN_239100-1, partial [Araneus ventricosus]
STTYLKSCMCKDRFSEEPFPNMIESSNLELSFDGDYERLLLLLESSSNSTTAPKLSCFFVYAVLLRWALRRFVDFTGIKLTIFDYAA